MSSVLSGWRGYEPPTSVAVYDPPWGFHSFFCDDAGLADRGPRFTSWVWSYANGAPGGSSTFTDESGPSVAVPGRSFPEPGATSSTDVDTTEVGPPPVGHVYTLSGRVPTYLRHAPTQTGYLKVWLDWLLFPSTGGGPVVTALTTYEWEGAGNPCLAEPLESPFSEANRIEWEIPSVPDLEAEGHGYVVIRKMTALRGHVPADPVWDGSAYDPAPFCWVVP